MNKIEKPLWLLFYFLIFTIILKIIVNFLGIQFEDQFQWFEYIFLGVPVILLIFHSIISLGFTKGIFFIILATATGTLFEHIGLRDGVFFGGHYVYRNQSTLFNVPITVILFWAVFIYTGYCLTNSFLLWLKLKKPNIKTENIWLALLLILLDGYFVVAIDFFMDPIAVKSGSWQWLEGGPYFGIPWGNFLGWFLVAVIVSGIFRIFEYFFPKKEEKFNKSIFIIPVLGYGIMAISFIFTAFEFNLSALAIIGSLFMIPQVIVNLLLFKSFIVES